VSDHRVPLDRGSSAAPTRQVALTRSAGPSPHSRDLRKGRVSQPGQVYLVTSATAGRVRLFEDFWLGRIVVRVMRTEMERGRVDSLCYVIMPDHLHWMFALCEGASLGRVMHAVKGYSAREINRRLGRTGPEALAVWQDGYHDHALRREEDLRAVARYVVSNPIRAGLVESLAIYPLWDAVWV